MKFPDEAIMGIRKVLVEGTPAIELTYTSKDTKEVMFTAIMSLGYALDVGSIILDKATGSDVYKDCEVFDEDDIDSLDDDTPAATQLELPFPEGDDLN